MAWTSESTKEGNIQNKQLDILGREHCKYSRIARCAAPDKSAILNLSPAQNVFEHTELFYLSINKIWN